MAQAPYGTGPGQEVDPLWALPLVPRFTAALFRPLLDELMGLLRDLDEAQWDRMTLAREWRVRDVVMHLIDGDLRKIAACRDSHRTTPESPIQSDRDLGRFINGLNAEGVAYGRRLSPRLLTDLVAITGAWVAELIEGLPPDGPSLFAVTWAGEAESLNWMDTGREYTERWHHQMQIRDAVGAPLLLSPEWMDPLLDFSVRALPAAYADFSAPAGTSVTLTVHGPTEGSWSVVRGEKDWRVVQGQPADPEAEVRVSADDAWRLFYNAMDSAMAERIPISGNRDLAAPLLKARSVIL